MPAYQKIGVSRSGGLLVSFSLLLAVCLAIAPPAQAANPILEPGFETVSHWAFSTNQSSLFDGSQSTAWTTEGSYSYQIEYSNVFIGVASWGQLQQTVDYSDIETITFDARLIGQALAIGAGVTAEVYAGSDLLWSTEIVTGTNDFLNQSIDVTPYSGAQSLQFRISVPLSVGLGAAGDFLFDNLRVTNVSNTIAVKAQDYSADVTSISFPVGAAGTIVSNPVNDLAQSQVFGLAGTARPVVTLVSSGAADYLVYLQASSFSNGVVSSEGFLLNTKGAQCLNADALVEPITFDGLTGSGVTISPGAANAKDLYLKVTLSALAGRSGTSTLTILAEKP